MESEPHTQVTTFSASIPARAALAGNPSDGYGGRVVATVVPTMSATVTVERNDRFQVGNVDFGHSDELATFGELNAFGDAALLLAAVQVASWRWPVAPCEIQWSTTIPRSVGLSGSSALVIATLRALAEANQQTIARIEMPVVALAAERQLGITAGLQDRVIQTFGGTQAMTFAKDPSAKEPFTQRGLQPRRALDLCLLFDAASAEPSQVFHGDLRHRYDNGDTSVRAAMRSLALAAETAEHSIETGDNKQLGAAMNQSFDIRASINDLSPSHVRLVEIARSCGLAVNYAGSGGAVVGLVLAAGGGEKLAALAESEGLGFARWTVPALA